MLLVAGILRVLQSKFGVTKSFLQAMPEGSA